MRGTPAEIADRIAAWAGQQKATYKVYPGDTPDAFHMVTINDHWTDSVLYVSISRRPGHASRVKLSEWRPSHLRRGSRKAERQLPTADMWWTIRHYGRAEFEQQEAARQALVAAGGRPGQDEHRTLDVDQARTEAAIIDYWLGMLAAYPWVTRRSVLRITTALGSTSSQDIAENLRSSGSMSDRAARREQAHADAKAEDEVRAAAKHPQDQVAPQGRAKGTVTCQTCGQTHVAEYHHDNRGEPIYVVVCTADYYEDFYTAEVVAFAQS